MRLRDVKIYKREKYLVMRDGDGESESTSGRDVIFFDLRIDMDTNVC